MLQIREVLTRLPNLLDAVVRLSTLISSVYRCCGSYLMPPPTGRNVQQYTKYLATTVGDFVQEVVTSAEVCRCLYMTDQDKVDCVLLVKLFSMD